MTCNFRQKLMNVKFMFFSFFYVRLPFSPWNLPSFYSPPFYGIYELINYALWLYLLLQQAKFYINASYSGYWQTCKELFWISPFSVARTSNKNIQLKATKGEKKKKKKKMLISISLFCTVYIMFVNSGKKEKRVIEDKNTVSLIG